MENKGEGPLEVDAKTLEAIDTISLATEASNPASHNLDQLSALQIVTLMNNEDARVAEATGQDEATALEALEVSGGETRTAILVLLAGLPPAEAREHLQKAGGFVRKALQS